MSLRVFVCSDEGLCHKLRHKVFKSQYVKGARIQEGKVLNTEEAESKLRDYLYNGLLSEIFLADQWYWLAHEIGKHSATLNATRYRALFGNLQAIISEKHTLAIAKIYDPPDRNFPTRSIPGVLYLLEQNASLWSPRDLRVLHAELASDHQSVITNLSSLNTTDLTGAVVAHFRSTLPHKTTINTNQLSVSLEALRESRNKVIAHNEAIDPNNRRRATWDECVPLVDYAKNFISIIGRGYLNIHFEINGEFIMAPDARRISYDLRDLLAKTNLKQT